MIIPTRRNRLLRSATAQFLDVIFQHTETDESTFSIPRLRGYYRLLVGNGRESRTWVARSSDFYRRSSSLKITAVNHPLSPFVTFEYREWRNNMSLDSTRVRYKLTVHHMGNEIKRLEVEYRTLDEHNYQAGLDNAIVQIKALTLSLKGLDLGRHTHSTLYNHDYGITAPA